MNIKLKSLYLQNFKGIKELKIDFEDVTTIQGANATGKTTIFDAYSWLLWNKDSLNRKDFNIKPFHENGEEKHGLESMVTGVLEVDGQEIELSKTYKEIWTKKRGQIQEVFTGNTTDYYINSVPLKMKEFNERIESLISEQEFNLLSNPLYFNQIIDKKDRRTILLKMITDVKKEDVLSNYEDLRELDLDNYSIEELKAMAKSSAKKINEEIESLPIRIDELEKSKNDYDFSALEIEKDILIKKIEDIDKVISKNSESANVIVEKNNQIQKIIDEMRKIKTETDNLNEEKERAITREYNQRKVDFEDKKDNLFKELSEEKIRLLAADAIVKDLQRKREKQSEYLTDLRIKWNDENSKVFDGSLSCPTCKREFDASKKEEILSEFNKNKANTLTEIESKANETKEMIQMFDKKLDEWQGTYESIKNYVLELELKLNEIGEFTEEKAQATFVDYPESYYNLGKEIEKIKEELKAISNNDNSSILTEKKELLNALNEINSKLGLKEQNKTIDKKISNYMEEEKDLANSYEEQQRIIYLCDEYIRIFTSLIQDKVNNLFKTVNFRLFEKQVNGELKETCEVTVNGVPYSDVNNAGKINAGLDVINTLSKHLKKQVPIFVDNAESVNKLIDVESQIVKLFVSKDKNLKIKGE